MSEERTTHWKISNALGRVIGLGFVLVGLLVSFSGGVQRDRLTAVVGVLVAVLGILLLLARPGRTGTKE
jgi:hypothetical protein